MTRKTTAYARKLRHARTTPGGDKLSSLRLLNRRRPYSQAEIVSISTAIRTAFECMRAGQGSEADFHQLAAAVNIALVCGEGNALCEEICQDAQEALMRVLDRKAKTQRWGLDGPALQNIPPALDLYEQLLTITTRDQIEHAMDAVVQRMQDGHVFLPEAQMQAEGAPA